LRRVLKAFGEIPRWPSATLWASAQNRPGNPWSVAISWYCGVYPERENRNCFVAPGPRNHTHQLHFVRFSYFAISITYDASRLRDLARSNVVHWVYTFCDSYIL